MAALLAAASARAQPASKVPRIGYLSAATIRLNSEAFRQGLRELGYVEGRVVDAGGLVSYGPHLPDLFRRAAIYVDKILELVVNLRTARALGLTIPQAVLLQADDSLP